MKLIELLNKIANGEVKEGTKIKVPFLNENFYEYVYLNDDKLWAKHKGGESIFTINDSELNEEVEIIEEKQHGRWKPKEREQYWYISSLYEILGTAWMSDEEDNFRFLTRNVFKTEKEAEEYLEYKTALLEAEKPFVKNEMNWRFAFSTISKELFLDGNFDAMGQGTIYLGQDKEVAQAFVDKWHKQILKYEFGIEG